MKTIMETTQLEFDQSGFLIDLVKNDTDLYVEIFQTLKNEQKTRSVKINPTVLSDVISILQNYHAKIPQQPDVAHKHITDSDQQKIQERYLKGVSIKDLAMQFDQPTEFIEMVLRNKGLEIVSNELPKPKSWKYFRQRKRKR